MPPDIFEPRTTTGTRGDSSWVDGGQSVREQISYIFEPILAGEHQGEMSFLRNLMLYDSTDERHKLEEQVAGAERTERCFRRAVFLMAVVAGVAVAGLGYSAILLQDFPLNKAHLILRIFCALGLASLVSLLTFVAFWRVARGTLNEQRDRCRRLVTRIVESRLGRPVSGS